MKFRYFIKKCFDNYVNFSGRASVSEFWYFNLFILLAAAASIFLDYLTAQSFGFPFFTPLVFVITFLPYCAVYQRRIQDVGEDGLITKWWIVPVFGVLARAAKNTISVEHRDLIFSGLMILVILAGLYITFILCKEGVVGPNQFGEDPKIVDETAAKLNKTQSNSSEGYTAGDDQKKSNLHSNVKNDDFSKKMTAIERISEMKNKGLINDEEFAKLKNKILTE